MNADDACRLLAERTRDLATARADLVAARTDLATVAELFRTALDEVHRLTWRLAARDRAIEHLRAELRARRGRVA